MSVEHLQLLVRVALPDGSCTAPVVSALAILESTVGALEKLGCTSRKKKWLTFKKVNSYNFMI